MGGGGERKVSWGRNICFKSSGPSVTKEAERDEGDNVKKIQKARERKARSTARLRRKAVVDWIEEDFHPRPAVGCGRCFRAGEVALTPSNQCPY